MMRLKVDENLPPFVAARLRDAGHDALTVTEQGMSGATDVTLTSVCQSEARVLVTLDLDFADIRVHPPGGGPGLVVLRLHSQDREDFERAASLLVTALQAAEVGGDLWIVEPDRIRVREAGPA